jgi:hypothetical protein
MCTPRSLHSHERHSSNSIVGYLGEDPRRVFSVKIASSDTVSYLKEVIKGVKKPAFDDITTDLWKVSTQSLVTHPTH